MRVLVVEDERKVAKALRDGLEAERYDVSVAASGEEGFFLVNHEIFDVVLLDLMLWHRLCGIGSWGAVSESGRFCQGAGGHATSCTEVTTPLWSRVPGIRIILTSQIPLLTRTVLGPSDLVSSVSRCPHQKVEWRPRLRMSTYDDKSSLRQSRWGRI